VVATGRLETVSGHEKLEARPLKPATVMLLRLSQRQYRPDVARVDVAAKLVLADEPKPVDAVPIRRDEQVLRHGHHLLLIAAVVLLGRVRQRVGVHKVEHGLERPRVHVVDAHAGRRPLLHRAKELRHEHRRPPNPAAAAASVPSAAAPTGTRTMEQMPFSLLYFSLSLPTSITD
jgi:hypothetical protein